MIAFALLGVIAGLDNLQVAAAIAMTPLTRARRVWFAAAFVVCEERGGEPEIGRAHV